MRYLLDTDVISNLMRREPSLALIRRLAMVAPEDQCTSAITLGELVYGAQRVPDRTADLLERIDRLIPEQLPVLPFDESAARRYGSIRAGLELAGTPIGEADLRIAAIAVAHGLTVVTASQRGQHGHGGVGALAQDRMHGLPDEGSSFRSLPQCRHRDRQLAAHDRAVVLAQTLQLRTRVSTPTSPRPLPASTAAKAPATSTTRRPSPGRTATAWASRLMAQTRQASGW